MSIEQGCWDFCQPCAFILHLRFNLGEEGSHFFGGRTNNNTIGSGRRISDWVGFYWTCAFTLLLIWGIMLFLCFEQGGHSINPQGVGTIHIPIAMFKSDFIWWWGFRINPECKGVGTFKATMRFIIKLNYGRYQTTMNVTHTSSVHQNHCSRVLGL